MIYFQVVQILSTLTRTLATSPLSVANQREHLTWYLCHLHVRHHCLQSKAVARIQPIFHGQPAVCWAKCPPPTLWNSHYAKFDDGNGNIAQRKVPRPAVISDYFSSSNMIDLHNQSRQFDLGLERKWVTQDGWFRIATSIIGITIVDCWKAYRHGMADPKCKELSIIAFADRLSWDCIHQSMLPACEKCSHCS